jgi:subtilase family serine protease
MKRFWAKGSFLLILVAGTVLAQSPDIRHIYARTPIEIIPQANPNDPIGILPTQFKAAYGFNRIPNQGQGVTIALIEGGNDPNIASDLAFYANYFHLGPCHLQILQVGNPQVGWDAETSLDVEQACALAPQANLLLVQANSGLLADLFSAIAVARSAPYNADVVSMSFGAAEFDGEQQYDSYLCNIVNGNGHPVTFVGASGDGYHNQPTYPSASPCVISAGGTTLALTVATTPSNPLQINYGHETAWFGSTGGISSIEPQPSWQNAACAAWSTTNRCTPDIASDANAIPGLPVYNSFNGAGWQRGGGTSAAAPDWAAFFALVNSARLLAGKSTLSQAAADLYSIYGSDYARNFHDITSGDNGNCGSQCTSAPGYDLVTGIGTYRANNLYSQLVAATN